jgi:hypothetical protein
MQEADMAVDFEVPDVRSEAERYRLYTLRASAGGGQPELTLLATTPTLEGVGVAIGSMADDARDAGVLAEPIGVLDGIERRWLAPLWHKGATV